MKIKLKDSIKNILVDAHLLPVTPGELPIWKFDWKKLYMEAKDNSWFYQIVLDHKIQGLLMLSTIDDQMLVMNNIEVAPYNYGKNGKYDFVAGCLIAYACLLSFKWGKEDYIGYLSFDSKTQLLKLYREKYGAIQVGKQKMFIPPDSGKRLIKQFLNQEFTLGV